MIAAISSMFAQYNLAELLALLVTPDFYYKMLMLAALEVTLSADNSIVLGLLVKDLPPHQRAKALRYGMIGAYTFRVIAIALGTLLIKLSWVKIVGGGYLVYLALSYFYKKFFTDAKPSDEIKENFIVKFLGRFGIVITPFVSTVITVETIDVPFSLDSVLASLGLSNSVWILLFGGCLGILAMRLATKKFVEIVEKVPELEPAAYLMIAFIGGKMLTSIAGYEVYDWVSYLLMVAIFGGAFVLNKKKETLVTNLIDKIL